MKLIDKTTRSILQRKGAIIFREDLAHLGSKSQISKCLRELQEEKRLFKLASGVYSKTRLNCATGKAEFVAPFDDLAAEVLRKTYSWLQVCSNDFKPTATSTNSSTQVVYFESGNHRVQKRLTDGKREFIFVGCHEHKSNLRFYKKGRLSIPERGLVKFILALTKSLKVEHSRKFLHTWAEVVTSLAGDSVKTDHVEDALIALKHAGKIDGKEMMTMYKNYTKEKKNVRSL